jgi:predicted O-methyltransferase YrrM
MSTLLTAHCLAQLGEGGQVVAYDHDARFAQETRDRLERAGLSRLARVEHAPLAAMQIDGLALDWYQRERFAALPDGGVDLLLIDGPPGRDQRLARYPALPELRSKLAKSAVVVLDDARRRDEQEILRRWQERFTDLESTFLTTEKGTAILTPKRSIEDG